MPWTGIPKARPMVTAVARPTRSPVNGPGPTPTAIAQSVTVVEWGSGLADRLSEERLGVTLTVDAATEARTAVLSLHLDPARADEVAATVVGLGGEPC